RVGHDRALAKRRRYTQALHRRRMSPVPTRAERPQTNLRAELTSFVGREADLAALARWLAEDVPLVTVVGPPGVGKTRLARRFGWQQLRVPPPAGVWRCDL